MRPCSIVLAAAIAFTGESVVRAGGIGDDQGEGNDTIFFGAVKDTRGVAIAGAHVNVKFKNMSFVTTTDVIGNYRLSTTIDPDQSEVSCSKDGYRQSGTARRSAPGGPKAPVEIDCTLQRPVMTRRPAAFIVFLFVATLAAPAWAEPVLLRYGAAYSTLRSIYALPIVVADRQSFFQREGLDFKVVVPIPGGSDKMIDALHDGTVDITHVAVPFLIRKALAGSDAVAVAAEFNNPIYSLLAQPGITNFSMLKGKRIGFADPGGTISMSIRKLLAMHGLQETDYSARVMEGTPARLNCLKRGECDAVVLGQPQDMAAQTEGFRLLGLSTDVTPAYLYTVTAARRSWAEAHKDTLVRYLRALAAAFQFIRDERNRNAVTEIISDTTGVSPAVAASVLDLYFVPERAVLPQAGEIDMNGLSQVIITMAEAGLLAPPLPAPENFVDRRYLQAAGAK